MMYGFEISDGQQVAVPAEVEVIRRVYSLYATCGNQTAVARETGLSRDMVSTILRDKRYVERGIITAEEFSTVQAALTTHTNPYAVSVPREKRVEVQTRFSLTVLPPESDSAADPDPAADPASAANIIQTIYDAIRPDEDGHTAMSRKEKRALMQYVERLTTASVDNDSPVKATPADLHSPAEVHSPENE